VDILLIVLGALCHLAGLAGCVLPILPGPPLSFLGILAVWGARGWEAETFDGWGVLAMGAAALVVSVLDNLAPVIGAKRYGASRLGFWMSVVGTLAGAIFFPPFGLVLGALAGALAGELLVGKPVGQALRAAWGVFVGTMLGILLKVAVSLWMAVHFVLELV